MVGEREEDPEAGSNSDLREMTETGGARSTEQGGPLGLVLLRIAQYGPVLVVEGWDNGAMET